MHGNSPAPNPSSRKKICSTPPTLPRRQPPPLPPNETICGAQIDGGCRANVAKIAPLLRFGCRWILQLPIWHDSVNHRVVRKSAKSSSWHGTCIAIVVPEAAPKYPHHANVVADPGSVPAVTAGIFEAASARDTTQTFAPTGERRLTDRGAAVFYFMRANQARGRLANIKTA